MSYRHRNALYLRISLHTVLPLYLYLDDKHTSWMTDAILQRVIADMKPLIIKKWREEEPYKSVTSGPKSKKFGVVDVYRGDTYQVAYFLQKNGSHNLLIKSRHFKAPPPPSKTPQDQSNNSKYTPLDEPNAHKPKGVPAGRKRKRSATGNSAGEPPSSVQGTQNEIKATRRSARSAAKQVTTGSYREVEEDDDDDDGDEQTADEPTRDSRMGSQSPSEGVVDPSSAKPVVKAEPEEEDLAALLARTSPMQDEDVNMNPMHDDSYHPDDDDAMQDEEEEQEAPKPVLNLRYSGYTLPDICLAIIVEPYRAGSVSRATTREPSVMPAGGTTRIPISRYVGLAPTTPRVSETPEPSPFFGHPTSSRDITPLPDIGFSGAGTSSGRQYPPIPLFHEEVEGEFDDDDDEGDAMNILQFSQAMNVAGTGTGVGADEGDEDDADALFGDADEGR